MTISIDGIEIVDQPFTVENQHNWILFPINAPHRAHTLSAVSDTGAKLEQTFTLPARGRRYAVLNYWNYQDQDGRHSPGTSRTTRGPEQPRGVRVVRQLFITISVDKTESGAPGLRLSLSPPDRRRRPGRSSHSDQKADRGRDV